MNSLIHTIMWGLYPGFVTEAGQQGERSQRRKRYHTRSVARKPLTFAHAFAHTFSAKGFGWLS